MSEKESPQDIIAKLEKTYIADMKSLEEAKEKVTSAQNKAFNSLQELASYRERFYLTVIQEQNKKLEEGVKKLDEVNKKKPASIKEME